jgi:hypothetical protein
MGLLRRANEALFFSIPIYDTAYRVLRVYPIIIGALILKIARLRSGSIFMSMTCRDGSFTTWTSRGLKLVYQAKRIYFLQNGTTRCG